MSNTKKTYIVLGTVIVVAAVVAVKLIYFPPEFSGRVNNGNGSGSAQQTDLGVWQATSSAIAGISFQYPNSWHVYENNTEALGYGYVYIGSNPYDREVKNEGVRIDFGPIVGATSRNFNYVDFIVERPIEEISVGGTSGYKVAKENRYYFYLNNYFYNISLNDDSELSEQILKSLKFFEPKSKYLVENVYIKNAYIKNGKHYVDVDFIQELENREYVLYQMNNGNDCVPTTTTLKVIISKIQQLDFSDPEIAKDNLQALTGCDFGRPSGINIWGDINDNSKIRTLQVSDNATIYMNGVWLGVEETAIGTWDNFNTPYWIDEHANFSTSTPIGKKYYEWEDNPWTIWIDDREMIDMLNWQYRA